MKDYGSKIREKIADSHHQQKKIAEIIGLSEGQLSRNLKDGKFKVDTLIKLSEFFNVEISYWFNDKEPMDMVTENIEGYGEENVLLNMLRTIKESERRISLLEKQLLKDKKRQY